MAAGCEDIIINSTHAQSLLVPSGFAKLPLSKKNIPSHDLQALFDLCNARYFDGALVPSPGFELRFSRAVKLFGSFRFSLETHEDWEITVAGRLRDHPFAALNTMVHEMIHMLAHQKFRESGDSFYLDEEALPGQPFVNAGHGAFFLAEQARLNQCFPEMKIDVKSEFGDGLYELDKIKPVRLLLVSVDLNVGRGMIYRLHDKARNDWEALRATAQLMHGEAIDALQLVEVAGQLGEGYPSLKKDNQVRKNMVPVGLRGYAGKVADLLADAATRILPEPATVTRLPARTLSRRGRAGEAVPAPGTAHVA
ncbi:SprT-like domain-containing protein [Hydrocarboniclastica marina]|uniref:SprT-like domain-containing protein n=1 Tax=Hydrocarboniclastica marina TaxID=2259620 RepID=UPI000C0B59C6|nr:SprT-like domain-containing protein [Hydrocarboniclastica marina]MAL97106.1 hypothetical protein [Alteromonadaceae bacterium]